MKITSSIISILIIAALFAACKKDDPIPDTPNTPTTSNSYSSLDDFFAQNALEGQLYTFNATLGGVFTGEKGSVLTVPANAFVHPDGSIVTGSVTMEMKEVFSNKDMIMAQKFPVSFFEPLNSGGEFFLEARQNGQALAVADEVLIGLVIPAQQEENEEMLLFFDMDDDLAQDSVGMGWGVAGEFWETNSSFAFNSADGTYEIELDTCHWGNIDAFMSVTYFDIDFNLLGVDGLDNSNTTAYALFVNENSVWPTGVDYWGNITDNVIHETHLADVPMNLVIISVVDDQLYSGHLEITPVQGTTYDITMAATADDALDALLTSMP